MPDKTFLETYPLYRKFEFEVPEDVRRVRQPSLNLLCTTCRSEQTFQMTNSWDIPKEDALVMMGAHPAVGRVFRAIYFCAGCRKSWRLFYLRFDEDGKYVVKIGQFPPWEISIDKNLSKTLGTHKENYSKGLACESQGYGIGAYAYYRRVVEDIIDALLDGIGDLMQEEEKQEYAAALAETKRTHIANDKIRLVKDLLPPSLRPDGMNPLELLYAELSKGIHDQNDEECLEAAAVVRSALVFMVNRVMEGKRQAKTFTENMRKLLRKKSKSKA
jgi:hypothetical protein